MSPHEINHPEYPHSIFLDDIMGSRISWGQSSIIIKKKIWLLPEVPHSGSEGNFGLVF